MNTYTIIPNSADPIKQDLQTAYTQAKIMTCKITKPKSAQLQAIGLRTYFIIYELLVIIYR